jgi:hypothetical protein
MMKIGQAIYAAPGADDGNPSTDSGASQENVNGENPEEPTVEAEVEDEEKK